MYSVEHLILTLLYQHYAKTTYYTQSNASILCLSLLHTYIGGWL